MRHRPFLAAALALAAAGRARAQEQVRVPALLGEAVRERLADPTLYRRVNEGLVEGRLARLLEDLHLQFKTFEQDSDGDLALGFSYDLAKSLVVSHGENAHTLDFVATGNVAFDQDAN